MFSEKPKLHEKNRSYRPGHLRSLVIDVTPLCNMRCPHCYFTPFRDKPPMSLDKLKVTLEQAQAMGVYHYILMGGEPTMDMERLAAVIELTKPEESYINITSNGWDFTRETARRLRELEADKVVFSLDSGIEEEHDRGRRKGSYRQVMAAVEHVLAEGLLAAVGITVTRSSLHGPGFKAAYEYTKKMKIRLDVQVAMPVGMWEGRKDVIITPEDAGHIARLREVTPILPNGQKAVNRDVLNYGGACHCPAAVEFMAISVDGHIMPCNFCQTSVGRVGEGELNLMREALMASPWFKGEVPHCLIGEDEEFIDRFITPHSGKKKPLDAYELFDLPRGGTSWNKPLLKGSTAFKRQAWIPISRICWPATARNSACPIWKP